MSPARESSVQRRKLLDEIRSLADSAVFGTLSETYRTCGRVGCHCQQGGPKHGPHLNISYRGEKGKTTGYYVPQGAEQATRRCGRLAKTAGMFAGIGRVKQGAQLAARTRERFPMKPSWGWIFACIAVVCLRWSLTVKASMNPARSCEKHSVAWSGESRSPSSGPSLRVLRKGWIRSRAGPQEFLFPPDVLLRAEDLDPAGPPWLESRGPPGIYRDLGRPVGLAIAKVATAALIERSNYASAPNFPAVGRPNFKTWGFATRFS
jgi:hypothetical protein